MHLVVPDTIDDPDRVSGGDVYDRRISDGLAARGWAVHMPRVPVGRDDAMGAALAAIPDGERVIVDGLVAARAPGAIAAAAVRLRIVYLAHMVTAALLPSVRASSDEVEGERRALRAAVRVLATSAWTAGELVRRGLAPADAIDVAAPGTDAVEPAAGTDGGRAILAVGVVTAHKGHDVLVDALAGLRDIDGWTCTIAGSLDTDARFADTVRAAVAARGLEGRVAFAGVLSGGALDDAYRRTDVFVAPSRAESYGMALADGLRRGIPAVASDAGGIPHTIAAGDAAILVPPGDADALRTALERWMTDPTLRARLRRRAMDARGRMPSWDDTARRVAAALERVR